MTTETISLLKPRTAFETDAFIADPITLGAGVAAAQRHFSTHPLSA